MTAQIPETLLCNGEEHSMCSEPLGVYLSLAGVEIASRSYCTALWRGYIGTWEIISDRLYLINLKIGLDRDRDNAIEKFFPGFPDRVFAHWFTGKIRLPQGDLLKYVHGGYCSVYERDIFLFIAKGVITKFEVVENGKSENPDAPEGYVIGAMTVLPSKESDVDGGRS